MQCRASNLYGASLIKLSMFTEIRELQQLDQATAAANQVLETITVISVISPITGAILITDLTTPTRCSFLY